MELHSLPLPVLTLVVYTLPISAVVALSSVSKKTRKMLDNQHIWAEIVDKTYSKDKPFVKHKYEKMNDWRLLCGRLHQLYGKQKEVRIRLVVIGDRLVGKTALLHAYVHKSFPRITGPNLLGNQTICKDRGKTSIKLYLVDIGGSEQHNRLRNYAYIGVGIVLICFNTNDLNSFHSVEKKWWPEVKNSVAKTLPWPCVHVLVGTQTDLRDLSINPAGTVTKEMGEKLAKKLHVIKYMEVSSKTLIGVNEVFLEAVDAYAEKQSGFQTEEKPTCSIL